VAGSAALLVFVLAGAFLFLYGCHYTAYLASRAESRQLLFLVGAVAVALIFLSRFLLLTGEVVLPEAALSFAQWAWSVFFSPFGVPNLPTYIGAFLLGPLLALAVNRFYGADRASTRAIRRYGAETEKLLLEAMEDGWLILVTLEGRKVYIGWPVYSPDLRRETNDFRLLPAVSGYRDEQTLELRLTTQYLDAYEQIRQGVMTGLQANDFETVLPLRAVVSANFFALDIDQDIFKMPRGEVSGSED
jgi:hypothetical protein